MSEYGVKETQCTRCSHREVCSLKEEFLAAQAAIDEAVLFIDAAQILKAYRERNTAGVLFWGILLLAVSIGMS